jgi:hypothetical protein
MGGGEDEKCENVRMWKYENVAVGTRQRSVRPRVRHGRTSDQWGVKQWSKALINKSQEPNKFEIRNQQIRKAYELSVVSSEISSCNLRPETCNLTSLIFPFQLPDR